ASASGTTTATRTTPAPMPLPASSSGGRGIAIAAAAVLLIAGAGGAWWWTQGRTDETPKTATSAPSPGDAAPSPAASSSSATAPGPAASSAAPPATSTAPSTSTAASSAAPPAPPPLRTRTPLESLQSLAEGAAPGFNVKATPAKAEVVTGKDKLGFEVRSAREGFVYVYLLSSGGELFLLFPNLLDKYNKIAAGATLSLPRASWPMNAGGPSGVNRFAVLVSERERDFGESGIRNDGVFPQFSLPVLSALEAARGTQPPPLLGKPVCDAGARCNDVYGVATFNITERDR
ncbi:MAG: DUF4384 domain-containing protein, partial [Gammaproteobacteria bacterium]|nr:DUF4384 domain-containing protein [Gammaproteobacteria bacterium]